jgi:hypothetical protein
MGYRTRRTGDEGSGEFGLIRWMLAVYYLAWVAVPWYKPMMGRRLVVELACSLQGCICYCGVVGWRRWVNVQVK